MSWVYNALFFVCILWYVPVMAVKGKRKTHVLRRRTGSELKQLTRRPDTRRRLWVHAVSVGEVMAVVPLVKELQHRSPEREIILTTVTDTGYQVAQDHLGTVATVIYAPLDFSWIVRRYVRTIDPELYITAETEIWPNLFRDLQKAQVPLALVNGRISDKSFRQYLWVRRWLRPLLLKCALFCMQSDEDARRIGQLGAPKNRTNVVGNMKFDGVSAESRAASRLLPMQPSFQLWVAGSTHPGEEAIVLDTYRYLRERHPQLRLLVAPRHPQRAADVMSCIQQHGLRGVCCSSASRSDWPGDDIYVLDTMGKLRECYALATVVFVGKSLAGKGGQNVLEPALCAIPVVVGPHVQNFRSVVAQLQRAGGIIQVQDAQALRREMDVLLRDADLRRQIGAAAREVIRNNQGATRRTLDALARFLKAT